MNISLSQALEVGGISLQLRACISSAALHSASEGSVFAPAREGSPAAMLEVDPHLLLSAMQPGLALALQGLRESLVQLALAHLEKQIADAVE